MVFGNGDNTVFQDFTNDVDVPGHELTHGVTQYTAGLDYTDQPGALNEATSDIFGACIDARVKGEDAGSFNWLIGEDVMAPQLYGEAIRSMAYPGTAYDDPVLGTDPQPATMSGHVPGGDPHLNSGIINRWFYLMAIDLGMDEAAVIWYATLQNLWPTASQPLRRASWPGTRRYRAGRPRPFEAQLERKASCKQPTAPGREGSRAVSTRGSRDPSRASF